MKYLVLLAFLQLIQNVASSPGSLILVSGYNSALNIFNITGDKTSGHVTELVSRLAVPDSLSWLDVDPASGLIYGISETKGEVYRMRLALDLSSITVLETTELPGSGPAHLLVDRAGRHAYSANYGSGTWSQLRLGEAGQLGGVARHETFPGVNCTSHPHQTLARAGWLWVTDLGCDTIYTMTSDPDYSMVTQVSAGCGPRHMALHPTRDLAVLLCEQKSLVVLYRIDMDTGSLSPLQELALSSEAADYGAEIVFNTAGDRVYASSRGTGVLVVYSLDPASQKMERIQELRQHGSWPRHFALGEDILVTSDQKGDSLQILHVEAASGQLVPGKIVNTRDPAPAFVTFLN